MLDQLRKDLIRDEDDRLKCYKCTAGRNTISVGRNLDDMPLTEEESKHLGCTTAELIGGKLLTQEQSDWLFESSLQRTLKALDRAEPWWRTRPDDVQRGMANMAYQMGVAGLQGFKKMLACLQAGDYAGARKHALDSKWAKSDSPKRAERVTALFAAGHPFN